MQKAWDILKGIFSDEKREELEDKLIDAGVLPPRQPFDISIKYCGFLEYGASEYPLFVQWGYNQPVISISTVQSSKIARIPLELAYTIERQRKTARSRFEFMEKLISLNRLKFDEEKGGAIMRKGDHMVAVFVETYDHKSCLHVTPKGDE